MHTWHTCFEYFRSQNFNNAASFVLCYTKHSAHRGHCSFYLHFKVFGAVRSPVRSVFWPGILAQFQSLPRRDGYIFCWSLACRKTWKFQWFVRQCWKILAFRLWTGWWSEMADLGFLIKALKKSLFRSCCMSHDQSGFIYCYFEYTASVFLSEILAFFVFVFPC